jgi:hypothetical protein
MAWKKFLWIGGSIGGALVGLAYWRWVGCNAG